MTQQHTASRKIGDVTSRLRKAFDSGISRPVAWRRRQLEAIKRMLDERESELLAAVADDLGKCHTEGWLSEIATVKAEIDYLLKHLERWTRPQRVGVKAIFRPAKAAIVAEPLGVVLVMSAWNYPVQLAVLPMAFALAAGNAVVVKPSEVAPATSAALARVIPDYLDHDAVAVVEGDVPTVTSLLTQRWDHIFYTGNGRVGRIVMEAAAKHLTPVTLELGGKSPAIVDKSANIGVAARRVAWGKFLNAGQTCVAPDYALVDRSVEAAFLKALVESVRSFYGDDPAECGDYGRIVNTSHWDRLNALLLETDSNDVVLGGRGERAARYLAPTILRGVTWDDPVMAEEIFGPVLPVVAVNDVAQAIAAVNAHAKPLALYVFAQDQAVIDRVVAETSSGGVGANVTMMQLGVPDLPFGGVGPSGMGAYHGKAGFDTFTHHKSVFQRPTWFDPSVIYPPYSGWKRPLVRRAF